MAGKKEKKKKLTKEERKRLKKEEEERRAREAEEARLQQEEAERMRLEQERLEAEERALRDAEERVLRGMQLITTDETVRDNQSRLTEALSTEYEKDRWERYMRCDGLPDPMTRQEVTGYLSSWREMPIEAEQYPEVMRRTDEVLRVIDDLERHVRDKAYGDGELATDMAAILQQYQDTQTEKLDVATYNLLTDLRPHVDLETNTVQFCSLSRHVSLAVWSNCSKNLKNKGFLFKDLGVRFELPKQLMDKDIAVRIMRTEYDHVSKFCRSQKMLDLAEFRARETLSDVVLEEDIRLEKEREEAKRAAQEQAEREAAEAERLAAEAASAKDKKPGFMSAGSSRSGSPDKNSAPGSPGKSPKGKKKGKKGGKKGKDKSKSRSPKRTPVPDPEPEPQVAAVPSLLVATDKEELNLRRYRVIGGLIHFDLLHIPPQPKVVGAWTLREVCEPRTVRRFPFRADYQPPPSADTLTSRRREPEEIEREIRQQEAEMQKLISTSVDEVSSGSPPPAVAESTTGSVSAADGQVSTAESRASVVAASETASARSMRRSSRRSLSRTGSRVSRVRISAAAGGDGADRDAELSPLPEPGAEEPEPPPPIDYALEVADRPEDFPLVETRLPETTLWFEPPFFVRWDEDKSCWSTQGFYDTRYNEENYVLQARTLRLGLFGLAVNRFSNLPYQNWAYAPTGPASGELSITAAVASVRIAIQDDLVSLCEVTGGSSNCLEEYYNKPMKPETFIQTLQRRGLDLFPEEDSYLYIEGSSLKHQPCEKHLYWCMALVGNACGFSSSRWNLLAGADNLVLQFKEMLSQQLQGNPALLLVRPRRTTIVECGETSQSWSDQEAPGMPYFADLYHLVESLGSEEARARVQAAPCTFVNCLHTLFTATRLLSYS